MAKKITITLILVVMLALVGVVYWHRYLRQVKSNIRPIATTSIPAQAVNLVTTTTTAAQVNDHPGMKLYRNDQFGFEFWYPEGWELKENVFGSPNIKLNVTIMKIDGQYTNQNDSFNIVTPSLKNNAVYNYQIMKAATSSIIIDGITGTEYQYEFEGVQMIDAYIPFGDLWASFGVDRIHEIEFKKIISSFKFLK